MKTTLRFNASASVAFNKADAEVTIELSEGEKLSPEEKAIYQKYVEETSVSMAKEIALKVQTIYEENPSLNKEGRSASKDMSAENVIASGGNINSIDCGKFVRNGNHTLGEASVKELQFMSGLEKAELTDLKNAAIQKLAEMNGTVSSPTPTSTPTNELDALKAMPAGNFVRGGNKTLGDANNKELNFIAGLEAPKFMKLASSAKKLLQLGFAGK